MHVGENLAGPMIVNQGTARADEEEEAKEKWRDHDAKK